MTNFGDSEPEDSWDADDPVPEQLDNMLRRLELLKAQLLRCRHPGRAATLRRDRRRPASRHHAARSTLMGSYFVPITDILAEAGCTFGINDINTGWERRSRSSGGFDATPLGVQWHHTASAASVNSDLNYMINGSPDRPVGNVLLDRAGIFWPVAAGAANTSGKGGPNSFSRGVCPLDKGNTKLFSIEIANDGVGEQYSQAQIDAAFMVQQRLQRSTSATSPPMSSPTPSVPGTATRRGRSILPPTTSKGRGDRSRSTRRAPGRCLTCRPSAPCVPVPPRHHRNPDPHLIRRLTCSHSTSGHPARTTGGPA